MAKKSKKDKRRRLTLRVAPEVADRVELVGKSLGLDQNAVVNLLIRRGLGRLELEAHAFQELGDDETDDQHGEVHKLMRENPDMTRKEAITWLLKEIRAAKAKGGKLPDVNGPVTVAQS